jgi:flagellar biosynthesis protein
MTARQDSGAPAPRAAALVYEARDAAAGGAPRLVAKGQGTLAEEIIRRAREGAVPIHRSRELIAALMQFDLDQQIPPALYVAVAEVLAWVHQLEAEATAAGPLQPLAIR